MRFLRTFFLSLNYHITILEILTLFTIWFPFFSKHYKSCGQISSFLINHQRFSNPRIGWHESRPRLPLVHKHHPCFLHLLRNLHRAGHWRLSTCPTYCSCSFFPHSVLIKLALPRAARLSNFFIGKWVILHFCEGSGLGHTTDRIEEIWKKLSTRRIWAYNLSDTRCERYC